MRTFPVLLAAALSGLLCSGQVTVRDSSKQTASSLSSESLVDLTKDGLPGGFVPPKVIGSFNLDGTPDDSQCKPKPAAGTYLFLLVVSSDGNLREAHPVVRQNFEIDPCMTEMASHYRFKPGTIKGKPVAVKMLITINLKYR